MSVNGAQQVNRIKETSFIQLTRRCLHLRHPPFDFGLHRLGFFCLSGRGMVLLLLTCRIVFIQQEGNEIPQLSAGNPHSLQCGVWFRCGVIHLIGSASFPRRLPRTFRPA